MRIAIDARWIFPEISGIGAYTRELIKALAVLDKRNSYLLLFDNMAARDRTVAETNLRDAPNFSAQCAPYGVFSIRNQFLAPGLLARNGIDVFHSPNYMIPLAAFPRNRRGQIKCVVTVHDVIPMIFPDHAPRSRKSRMFPIYSRLMREVGMRADAVITVSEASRKDVVKYLRIPPADAGKVRVIYNGVSERFCPGPAPRSRMAPDNGAGQVRAILYVGRADPYKNLPVLVRAVAMVRKDARFPVRLVIAGSPDKRYPEPQRLARDLGIEDAVRWSGYLSDDELVALYRRADLLAHPSRYEGFGLQVVEAMACGTPVICGNAGSLPEIAGDAAIMVAPDDALELAEKIKLALADPALASQMSEKGLRQARKFTWTRAASETLALYEEIIRCNCSAT